MTKSTLSQSDKAYQSIKNLILSGQLKPGERIAEEQIVKLTGLTSRTPVRDAMRMLAAEHLVVLYPRRYSEVANYNQTEIAQTAIIRLNLEILACKLAIEYAPNHELKALQEPLKVLVSATEEHRGYDRIEADMSFHKAIAAASHNPYLIDILDNIYDRFKLIQIILEDVNDDPDLIIKQHTELVDSLLNRDTSRCIEANDRHMKSFYHLDIPLDFLK